MRAVQVDGRQAVQEAAVVNPADAWHWPEVNVDRLPWHLKVLCLDLWRDSRGSHVCRLLAGHDDDHRCSCMRGES
jgi:hypothetical protein